MTTPTRRLPAPVPGRPRVAPSLLASDFARLGAEIAAIQDAGADVVHVDVMDGHFVPNLTVGPPVVASIRRCTDLPFDVHLMLDNPQDFVGPFAEAGADNITIHAEIDGDPADLIRQIHAAGCTAGVCLRPATPASEVAPFISDIELVLVMTVEPGFGGQRFREDMLPKIREVHDLAEAANANVHIEVDGGIDPDTAPRTVGAGATLLVAGTSVFRSPTGPADAIEALRGAPR
jgi:ribulose-phosphate 3-epimerase